MSDRDMDDIEELATIIRTAEKASRHDNHVTASSGKRRRGRDEVDAPEAATDRGDNAPTEGQMWAVYGGRNYSACERAVDKLPPGQYTIDHNSTIGIFFRKEDINLDELMILPDSRSSEVIADIQKFWTLEDKFRSFGFLWKRGVMLWGPPGSGKTSTLQIISKNIVDAGGISIYVSNPDLAAKGLKLLRPVEPNRPIVIMLEDIDAIIDEYGEPELLALMDGELQIDNVVFVATTNYPERLDRRFVNRPSRFDIIKKIGMPSPEARRVYLTAKNKRLVENKTEMERWVTESNGFSIAHLKELIISIEVFGQPLEEASKRLRKMGDKLSSSTSEGTFGFINSDDPDED
jgi:hypothetical protein